jgi:RNA polymerase sigma-70 factor (ECF subfamily)
MSILMKSQSLELPLDDARLAQQARADEDAFAELYRRHVQRVYRYHLAHTGSVKDAEDLTSQTFMAALEGIASYRGSGSFAAWLMGIAARKRALLFRGRSPELPLDEAQLVSNPGLPTDLAAVQRLQIDQAVHAMRLISRERAEALALCYFSGLTPAEAGRVLGKSETAVRMLISRGLRDLRTRTSLALEVDYE